MKYAVLALLLVILIGCTTVNQQVASKPKANQELVTSGVKEAPVLVPEATPAVPKETMVQNVTSTVTAPAVPAKPVSEYSCIPDCERRCEQTAQNACTQHERSECRSMCGETIEPSACTQACTYISQPSACKQQMEQFCKSACVPKCYRGSSIDPKTTVQ